MSTNTRLFPEIRRIGAAMLAFAIALPTGAADPAAKTLAAGDLRSAGAVDFLTSCDPSSKADFDRAAALLHSFFYEESRRIFTAVAEKDPQCAMAQWGIAQTWWHPIWAPPNAEEMTAGRAAAERAMALDATPREKALIVAIDTYYNPPAANKSDKKDSGPVGQSCHGPVGPLDRVVAYEKAMQDAVKQFPKDYETQVLHAFAVLAMGYATPLDTTLAHQKKAAERLEKLWKKNPQHPGVTHYLIHSYDYPALAKRGLPAAEAYAAIAPWVPHALHMPSHIFTRLGRWDDAIAGNSAAAEAQRSYSKQQGRAAMDTQELHALDYMMYSYLQQARDAEAKKVLDQVAAVRATFPENDFVGAYALAAAPARFALERNAWEEAARLPVPSRSQWQANPFTEGLIEYAHAIGRARTGDFTGARKAVERMAALRDATTDPRFGYFKKHLELQIQAANAWLAHGEGRSDEAVATLRTVADAEDALGKHPVTPGALVPAREQLGDLLLILKRHDEALTQYEAALKIYPARFNGLYGAALAAERKGDRKLARTHYEKLAKQTAAADGTRAELAHARAYLAAIDQSSGAVAASAP